MGWRELTTDKLYDVMRDMAMNTDDPVAIACIEREGGNYHEPHLYGAAFRGVPASARAKAQTSRAARAQIAIIACCTAQAHGRRTLKEASA